MAAAMVTERWSRAIKKKMSRMLLERSGYNLLFMGFLFKDVFSYVSSIVMTVIQYLSLLLHMWTPGSKKTFSTCHLFGCLNNVSPYR